MALVNSHIALVQRPVGVPKPSDFQLVESPLREPADGEFVVDNLYLSLDPYQRGRMSDAKSYAQSLQLGDVIIGGTVGEVVQSRHPKFAVGETVVGMFGWQRYGISNGAGVMKVDVSKIPASAYLGAVGMPGVTAWYGLHEIGKPKAGETLVVAAASGAVGSVVGQLAKHAGLRAIGIAGGADKCAYVKAELGFDDCLDHRAPDFAQRLAEATPNGIDIDFENVGGEVFDRVLARLNPFARIALCGFVSQYNATGAPYALKHWGALLTSRATLRGFIVSEHMDRWPAALAELAQLVATGRLKYRESITDGLANAPEAFIGMLAGKNFGKTLVKLR